MQVANTRKILGGVYSLLGFIKLLVGLVLVDDSFSGLVTYKTFYGHTYT